MNHVCLATCGRDESKNEFPGESEEVHDVVAAGRHLLLALLALLLFIVVCIGTNSIFALN